MTPEQRRQVRDLFESAIDRDATSAASWVEQQTAADSAVRAEVLSLLQHHSQAGRFLVDPIVERAGDLLAEDEAIAVGRQIGAYTILRELGRGGMGRVYLASDGRLGRTVALKALAPHLLREPVQRERLRREAQAAGMLTHPGICTVYALEEIDGELYIATEFVDGHTLGDEIRSGRRPSRHELAVTAKELAAALASAHAKGIVHRDLKPENIMRGGDGRLKVLDFGLAQVGGRTSDAAPAMTQPGMLIGTPAYMAPEQINGLTADARADVFAFGVVLYEYACGVHPFAASTSLGTVARVLESDARPLAGRADVSIGVADVIARCLRKSPADRFGSAAEVLRALDATRSGPSVLDAGVGWWRIHQVIVALLYAAAATVAWQIKEWIETPITVGVFLALGAAATVGGVLRGHLVFTSVMNGTRLTIERARARRAMQLLDVLAALLLCADGLILSRTRALPAVFTLALGVGIFLAAIVLEPATTTAAFGDQR